MQAYRGLRWEFRRRASCIGDGSWISLSPISASTFTRTRSQSRLPRQKGGKDVREYGRITTTPTALKALATKLSRGGRELLFCYEAGPCGYGIQRQLSLAGHECIVVAPSLIPRKPGDRIKTARRDAINLAKLHRAGELTAVWAPD